METNKYYTPTIEEFHVGFEYEEWIDAHPEGHWSENIFGKELWYENIKDLLISKNVRVKYLDREDIESLGWELQSSSWERKTLKRSVIKYEPFEKFGGGRGCFELVKYEHNIYQLLLGNTGSTFVEIVHCYIGNYSIGFIDFSNNDNSITDKTPIMEFQTLFKGHIKNKSELKVLMKQIGI